MAGALKSTCGLNLTGLGEEQNLGGDEVTLVVPVEHQGGYCITDGYLTESLQISDLAPEISLSAMYCLFIEVASGVIYVKLNTEGTAAIDSSDAHLALNVSDNGEEYPIPVNPDNNAGIQINGDSATAAFRWKVFSSA